MFIVPTLIRPKAPIGPKRGQDWSNWGSEKANPWKFRDEFGNYELTAPVETVSTDEDWWAGVWEDILSTHGHVCAEKFWKHFSEEKAKRAREVALKGTKASNWSSAVVAFNSANHEAYDRENLFTDEFLASLNLTGDAADEWIAKQNAEYAEISKKVLGKWIYETIRSGDHGAIRKLSELVSGKKKPPEKADMTGTEKHRILASFATLLVEHYRLPTKTELLDSATPEYGKGNFPALVRELGLNGLPGRMPKRA